MMYKQSFSVSNALKGLSRFKPHMHGAIDVAAATPWAEHVVPAIADGALSAGAMGFGAQELSHMAKQTTQAMRPYLWSAKNMITSKTKELGNLTRSAFQPPPGAPLSWKR